MRTQNSIKFKFKVILFSISCKRIKMQIQICCIHKRKICGQMYMDDNQNVYHFILHDKFSFTPLKLPVKGQRHREALSALPLLLWLTPLPTGSSWTIGNVTVQNATSNWMQSYFFFFFIHTSGKSANLFTRKTGVCFMKPARLKQVHADHTQDCVKFRVSLAWQL